MKDETVMLMHPEKTVSGRVAAGVLLAVLCFCGQTSVGQTLRFSNHREVAIPDYALLMIGPFYSSMSFSQSAGFRYVDMSGSGMDFLYGNERGEFSTNGMDYPLVSSLELRNYLLVSRSTDLDISIRASYAHYPMKTQEDQFVLDLAPEGVMGELSSEFNPTPFLKVSVYESLSFKTEFVDTRGLTDRYGGEGFKNINNTVGLNADWLMAEDRNLAFSVSRNDVIPVGDEFADQERFGYSESLAYEQRILLFLSLGSMVSLNQTSHESTNRSELTYGQVYSIYANVKISDNTSGSGSIGYSLASTSGDKPEGSDSTEDTGVLVCQGSLKTQITRNLVQAVGISRSRQGGFKSDFEVSDNVNYKLDWKGDATLASLFSSWRSVDPDQTDVPAYTDWTSGINIAYPLTSLATLTISSSYSMRDNDFHEDPSDPVTMEVEWIYDYETWVSQIGTSFALLKDVSLSAYVQHVERMSDSPDLTYEVNTAAVDLMFSHQF